MQYIEIDKIIPHPNNPRKNIGDVAELADSIRESGILQNLTVVPATITETVPGMHGSTQTEHTSGYMAVIGHRRLKAARLAGLSQVPCVVADFDEKTQLAVMLSENMQRSDLTLLEEAESMQLMLELGDTFAEVAKRTGLSDSTIRKRVKWVKIFGANKLSELQEREIKLEDYEKLYKIEDKAVQNEVLGAIGTSEFEWKLKTAMREQAEKSAVEEIDKILSGFAVKTDKQTYNDATTTDILSLSLFGSYIAESSNKVKELSKKFDASLKYFYTKPQVYSTCYVYILREQTAQEKTADVKAELEKDRKERIAKLKGAFEQAYEMRMNFAQTYKFANSHKSAIEEMTIKTLFEGVYFNKNVFSQLFGVEIRENWEKEKTDTDTFPQAIQKLVYNSAQSEYTMQFRGIYCRYESKGHGCYNNQGVYFANMQLEELYEFLGYAGYMISTEEQQLLDGTHALYG